MKRVFSKAMVILAIGMLASLSLGSRAVAQSSSDDQWKFRISTYSWLAGQKGRTSIRQGLPAAKVNVDFVKDILGNINSSLMAVGEVRKGRFGLMMDLVYTDIEDGDSTPAPFFSTISARTKSWIVSAAGLYRLYEGQGAHIDALAGARYWSVDTKMSLKAGLLPGRNVSHREEWFDPIIGCKGLTFINESKFFISGAMALGGFSVGSMLMWDVSANLGYEWMELFSITIGYRYLDVDYDRNDFIYDISQSGPVLGFSFRF